MKNVVLLFVSAILTQSAVAQYRPVDNGSSIEFNVKHFGLKTNGSFSGLQGQITFDRNSLNDAKFDVSIDASSIQTGVDMRDNHLRGEGYFEATKYPRIHFASTKITPNGKSDGFLISGQLTIRNHSKDISFPFTATQTGSGYLFKGSFSLSRKDYKVGSSGVISDNVDVLLSISATK
jgi:polyisoprenoid-binding protein YceI